MNIKSIAKEAGVSPATVSLVLNNKAGVSEERRRAIQELLNKHGYVRRAPARDQVSILLLKYVAHGTVVEHNGDFINQVLWGLESEAGRLRIKLTTRSVHGGDRESFLAGIANGGFDGVIVIATEMEPLFAEELANALIPVVSLDNIMEGMDVDAVVMDNRGGVLAAMRHLVEKGHRRIGFIGSSLRHVSNFALRFRGYKEALKLHGLEFNPDYVMNVVPTMDGSFRDISAILEKNPELPTAFFASNDSMGVGLIKALKTHNRAVPEKVSVIGFDDLHFCTVSDPMLTTMAVPKETMGRLAVQRIYERATAPAGARDCVKTLVFPPLVERESVRQL